MPTNCCAAVYEEGHKNGMEKKLSFFRIPDEEDQRIHAIRRDVGPNFS